MQLEHDTVKIVVANDYSLALYIGSVHSNVAQDI